MCCSCTAAVLPQPHTPHPLHTCQGGGSRRLPLLLLLPLRPRVRVTVLALLLLRPLLPLLRVLALALVVQ